MADTVTEPIPSSSPIGPTSAGAIELEGPSTVIGRVRELVRRTAPLDSGVLIVGERGADAASVARELHSLGRAATPMVLVECGSRDGARLERTLFGSPRGRGRSDLEAASPESGLAAARDGTLFLRDAHDLPAAVQSRLARIARDGAVRINGEPVRAAFRFVASAPPTIDGDVRAHRFRADLHRRMAVSRIDLPPLRQRREDVPILAVRLLDELARAAGLRTDGFTQASLALLSALEWPGNLGELRDVIERVLAAGGEEAIQIERVLPALHLQGAGTAFAPDGTLRDARLRFERNYVAAVLQHHGWRMSHAAQTLGIQRPNLYRKARQLGIPLARATE